MAHTVFVDGTTPIIAAWMNDADALVYPGGGAASTWAKPGAIGGTTPAAGTFTSLSASSFVSTSGSTTWTPMVTGNITAGTTTYVTQSGFYTQNGNVVTASILLSWTTVTGTGILKVSLPIANMALSTAVPIMIYGVAYSGPAFLYIAAGASAGLVYYINSSGVATAINISANCNLTASFSYLAA